MELHARSRRLIKPDYWRLDNQSHAARLVLGRFLQRVDSVQIKLKRLKLTMPLQLIQLSDVIPVRWRGMANLDRKSTRLNSSHVRISYAVFCLKKKNATDDKAIRAGYT